MDPLTLAVAMGCMGGLGALFSVGLALAHLKLHVDVDPRVELVTAALPGVNCGGCGYPGCSAFADALVQGKMLVSGCPVNTQEGMNEISRVMGVQPIAKEKEFARILCRGGHNETFPKGVYRGIKTCLAADLTFGGDKLCSYGCLGFGDCVRSCPFDAISIDNNGLPVVNEETCTGCGNCASACPRNIIEIHPARHNLFVFCKSLDEAKYTRLTCLRACTGCKSCQKKAGEDHIKVIDNLARINYEIYGVVDAVPTTKCRNQAIDLLYPLDHNDQPKGVDHD